MRIFKYFIPLVFLRFWIWNPFTTWDVFYPILSLVVLFLGLSHGLARSIIFPLLAILIIPLFSEVVPFNITSIQNVLILLPFSYNYKVMSTRISLRGLFLIFFLLSLFYFTNSTIFSLDSYNMVTVLPFFDTVDASFFFLLFLALFLRINRRLECLNYFVLICTILCVLGVLLSGNRFSLIIMGLLGVLFMRKRIILFVVSTGILLSNWIIENLIVPFVPQKVVEFLIHKSFYELLSSDSSFLVRIRNITQVWENSSALDILFGFGCEARWRGFLLPFRNQSMDNSLVVYFFTYGVFGIMVYFWLLSRIRKLAGDCTALVFFFFSMMQDVAGNFLYMSSLVLVVIISNMALSHE